MSLPFPINPREGTGASWSWSPNKKGTTVALSNKNLTALSSGSSWNGGVIMGTKEFKNGNHYWEVKIDHSTSDMVGVVKPELNFLANSAYSSCSSQCWFLHHSSGNYGNTTSSTPVTLAAKTGDTVGCLLEWEAGSSTFALTYYRNRVRLGTAFRMIPPPVVAACELYSSPAKVTLDPKARKP